MILIQRYIFKELLYNFSFTFVVVSMIMLLVTAMQVIFKYPATGLLLLFKGVPLMLSESMTIIIPASVLVSTVMTYGRIAADNELTTLRASGIHVLRVLIPGLLFGAITSFALIFVNDRLVPEAKRQVKTMIYRANISTLLDAQLRTGIKKLELKKWLLTWEDCAKLTEEEGTEANGEAVEKWRFSGLSAMECDDNGVLVNKILARSMQIETDKGGTRLIPTLYECECIFGRQQGSKIRVMQLEPLDFGSKELYKVRLSMRTLPALAAILERESRAYPPHETRTEIHKRITDSCSPLIFVFLCLPVAILFKQQNRMVAFLISILLAMFVYYPVTLLGEIFAKEEVVDPVLCLWPGNILLVLLGMFLILKVMKK